MTKRLKILSAIAAGTLISIAIVVNYVHCDVIDDDTYRLERRLDQSIYFAYRLMQDEPMMTSHGYVLYWRDGGDIGNIAYHPFEEGLYFSTIVNYWWTRAYIFKPGTTRAEIEAIVGFEYDRLPQIVKEEYTQILIVYDWLPGDELGRVEVNVNMYSRKDYKFDFGEFNDTNYIKIYFPGERSLEYIPRVRVERCEDCEKIVVRKVS